MDSKKLGLFAAAALTVLATQANAGNAAKKDAKSAVKADGEMVCASSCAPNCAGKTLDTAKDQAACEGAKGKWITKAEFKKQNAGKKADAHDHK